MLARVVVGAVLFIAGVIWIGQGVGWIGGSFMTGAAIWAVIGAVSVLLGGSLLRSAIRAR